LSYRWYGFAYAVYCSTLWLEFLFWFLSISIFLFSHAFFSESDIFPKVYAITFLIIYLPIISDCFSGFPFAGWICYAEAKLVYLFDWFYFQTFFPKASIWLFPLPVPDFWLSYQLEFIISYRSLFVPNQIALIVFLVFHQVSWGIVKQA